MRKLNNIKIKLFSLQMQGSAAYFKNERSGRPAFFPKQLKSAHGIRYNQAVKMSAAFNKWLDIVDAMRIPVEIKKKLVNCTYIYSAKKKVVPYRCKSKICPWCASATMLQALNLFNKLKPKGIIEFEGVVESKSDITKLQRNTKPKLCKRLMTIKSVKVVYYYEQPAFYLTGAHLIKEADESTEESRKNAIMSTFLLDPLSFENTVTQEYMELIHGIRNLSV